MKTYLVTYVLKRGGRWEDHEITITEDVVATYNFMDMVDDGAIQFLAIKYIKLLDQSNK